MDMASYFTYGASIQLSNNLKIPSICILNVISDDPERQYSLWSGRASPSISPALLRAVQKIGQLQLLRLHASSRLNSSTQFEAAHLHEALHTLNL